MLRCLQNVVEAWCYVVVRDPKENQKRKMEDEGEERRRSF
jgi:hypothetical protein